MQHRRVAADRHGRNSFRRETSLRTAASDHLPHVVKRQRLECVQVFVGFLHSQNTVEDIRTEPCLAVGAGRFGKRFPGMQIDEFHLHGRTANIKAQAIILFCRVSRLNTHNIRPALTWAECHGDAVVCLRQGRIQLLHAPKRQAAALR